MRKEGQVRNVSKIRMNKGFSFNDLANDIALLKLETPFEFSDKVAPIKLPFKGQETTGNCTVTGWGTLSFFGQPSDILQKVTVPVVPDDKCRESYGKDDIKDSMICAGEAGKDSCQGDSGGPMRCGDYLGGIVSWGQGCASPGFPGVYTQVSYFIDWINENIFTD